MFKIGEFSKLAQVSVRMLRYYDEAGLLKPAQTDPLTGYRLYTAQQIPTLNRILFLRGLGFSVADIAQALKNWDPAFLDKRLEERRGEIEAEIAARRQTLAKIELAKRDLQCQALTLDCEVTIRALPACNVFSLRRRVADYWGEGALWQEMAAYAKARGICFSEETFSIYHDADYREKEVDIEVCAPVAALGQSADGFAYRLLDAVPLMACTMVYGPFENIAGAYRRFAGWLAQHNQYKMSGLTRQLVRRGPWNESDPAQYLTQIQIPLQRL